jgi:hypothetical protein
MSEYQYYEFQAIDRTLTEPETKALRAISGRALITPSSFANTYNYGDFRGDPAVLMEKYFDAFVYVANWGAREFMLRLPARLLDPKRLRQFCAAEGCQAGTKNQNVIITFRSQEEEGDWEQGEGWLSALVPLRADLARGDLRALYLGWLLCAQSEQLDEDDPEPPPPPGLRDLTPPLKSLADFLRLDEDLIAAAAEASAGLDRSNPSREQLIDWIESLPESRKNAMLLELAERDNPHFRAELLRCFEEFQAASHTETSVSDTPRRTVAELLAAAKARAEQRQEQQQRAQARARTNYLNTLAKQEPETWQKVEALIQTKRQGDYDQAVQLLKDLADLGTQTGRAGELAERIQELRLRHSGKPSFQRRLIEAGLAQPR